jgi:tetratricopeptide (TPR) repeat protein
VSEPALRAQAACNLAASLARAEEGRRAEQLYQEGMHEIPEGPQYAMERIGCLKCGALVAEESGNINEAVARMEASLRVLRESPFDQDVFEVSRWSDLAEIYSSAGRHADSIAAFEKTAALMSTLGRDKTGFAINFFNNYGLELYDVGRPFEAETMFRKAIDISRSNNTEDEVSPMVLLNYSRVLLTLGHSQQAQDYADRAYSKSLKVGLEIAVDQALFTRAKIRIEMHDPDGATKLFNEAEGRLRPLLPPGHYAFAVLGEGRALIAEEKKDFPRALQLISAAVSLDEATIKAGKQGAFVLPELLVTKSRITLEAGQPGQAIGDARRALDELRKVSAPGALSGSQGKAWLALAQALSAAGKSDEAKSAAKSAVAQLQSTMGPEHPETRAARLLAGGQ